MGRESEILRKITLKRRVEEREPTIKSRKGGHKDGIKSWRLFWGRPNVVLYYLCAWREKCFDVRIR